MKKIQLILCILIISSVSQGLNAQNAKPDSLLNLLEKHKSEDTTRVNLLHDIASSLRRIDQKKGLTYAEEALELSEKLNFKKGKANSLKYHGIMQKRSGNYPKTPEYYQKSLRIREKIGDKQGITTSLNNIGILNSMQGNCLPQFAGHLSTSL